MKIVKRDFNKEGVAERLLVTGMIVSDKVLKELSMVWQPGLLSSPPLETVTGWCLSHFEKYGRAPGADIKVIFKREQAKDQLGEDVIDVIRDFLSDISDEFSRSEKFNEEYALDQAVGLLKERALRDLADRVKSAVMDNNVTEAEAALANFKRIERVSGGGINPFADKDAIFEAFDEEEKPLFTIPGAAGSFLNSELVRDSFISILAPEKRGKTWLMLYLAKQALKCKCNVALFEIGDMSEKQVVRRFGISATGLPSRTKDLGTNLIPILDCKYNQQNDCDHIHRTVNEGCGFTDEDWELFPDWEPETILKKADPKYQPCSHCVKCHPEYWKGASWWVKDTENQLLDWRTALIAGDKFSRGVGNRKLRLDVHPSDTVSVTHIEARLDIWEGLDGFIPDVVIIDYADLLLPPDKKQDYRHQQNQIWKSLRGLSQKRHICLITATQASSDSYDARLLKMNHFGEDKRKLAHVTGMLGLNQTVAEKRKGLMRWNWVVLREGRFDNQQTCTVLQDLRRGRPVNGSYYT